MYSKSIKELIVRLYKTLVREANVGNPLWSIKNPLERAHRYTDIPVTTLKRWLFNDTPTTTNHQREEQTTDKNVHQFRQLDSFDINLIARTVKRMLDTNIVLSLRKLQKVIKDEHSLVVSKTTLWRVMKLKKYKFKKTYGNRQLICERPDLQRLRAKFLRDIRDYRARGLNIVYLDETWINQNHTHALEWMSEDGQIARRIPVGRGQRWIILHAVDRVTGFLPNCKLVFKSHSVDGRDYLSEMNAAIFEDWVVNKLLPSLNEPTVIVMDNASYHSREDQDTKPPTLRTKVADMKRWLTDRQIPFDDKLKKRDLYMQVIVPNKPPKEPSIDKTIRKAGHYVLRQPPYHCEFNPVEMLWGIIKGDVADNNVHFTMEEIRVLAEEAISKISLETIQKTFDHVIKVENHHWEKDGLSIAPIIPPIRIDLAESDTSPDISPYCTDED